MEVCLKSSWFLLLFGFALFAATLQEPANCPSPDQVSCTTGDKCEVDEDCDKQMICCSNHCYTKRCIPNTKGVQGGKESDGPSESECRPYIEKALKELETGEAAETNNKESSERDNSAEDIPTVEITDDSSHQVQDTDGEGDEDDGVNDSDESSETDIPDDKEAEQEVVHETSKEGEGEEKSVETADSQEDKATDDDKKEEHQQEEQGEEGASKEEDAESVEQNRKDNSQEIEDAKEAESAEDQVTKSTEDTEVVDDEDSVEKDKGEESDTGDTPKSEETKEESVEDAHEKENLESDVDEEESAEEKGEVSAEQDTKESVEDRRESEEKQPTADESEEDKDEGDLKKATIDDTTDEEEDTKSAEEQLEEVKRTTSEENSEEATGKCPPAEKISCQAGKLCGRTSECSDHEICCPNKCYRQQCVAPAPESEEDSDTKDTAPVHEDDSESDEIDDVGNCPLSNTIACGSGAKCGRNKDCGDGEICCTNKCYRKQCVPPAPESAEDVKDQKITNKVDDTEDEEDISAESGETNCPPSFQIACGSGEKCGRSRECDPGQVCCPNKCYRKQCVSPLEASDDKVSSKPEDAKKKEKVIQKLEAVAPKEDAEEENCPRPEEVPCNVGEKCGDSDDCDDNEVCCPSKCYRKQCVQPADETVKKVASEAIEKEKGQHISEADVLQEFIEEDDCPPANEIPCNVGQKCGDRRECRQNEICCPNKCYRKECISSLGSVEQGAEKPPMIKEKKKGAKVKVEEVIIVKRIPVKAEDVKIVTKKVIRQVKRQEESEEEEDTSREPDTEGAVEDLSLDTDIPTNLRTRDHVEHLLKLDKESSEAEDIINKVAEITLKELKKLYENAIKPLEVLYKYRDLSNRHFGDAEIFSKPLILFMGPWSGGKSSIINYLVNNEYNETSLRTGAEPSPAYFNILMYGEEPEVIDGTELAADFTFSGLQKFGQGLEERLRGVKLPSKLLEKVNIVEIPGILEVRKQVSRVFPFNDACQWFIDRADIIFLVYDPSKLDVGPETEAILDQLKGREHQTRIILNKADQVKPEELMRVQGALIWNISPLMSSPQPPVMYTTSLWSRPYEPWAPMRLLQAQERAFLRDLRTAVEKRIENKIASARRFAVRVRNHAKMVDCYLTTYYNHKSVFGNRKQVANEIIEHPQDYHIYEGLSTLTNISRYDLPDPDVYKYFFKLNPLYDFQQLSATCTYFRGCPINRLDIAIAYDLPELVGTHRRNVEESLASGSPPQPPVTPKS